MNKVAFVVVEFFVVIDDKLKLFSLIVHASFE